MKEQKDLKKSSIYQKYFWLVSTNCRPGLKPPAPFLSPSTDRQRQLTTWSNRALNHPLETTWLILQACMAPERFLARNTFLNSNSSFL